MLSCRTPNKKINILKAAREEKQINFKRTMIDNLCLKIVLGDRDNGSISSMCWNNITVNLECIFPAVKEKLKYLQENKTLEFTTNKHRLHVSEVCLCNFSFIYPTANQTLVWLSTVSCAHTHIIFQQNQLTCIHGTRYQCTALTFTCLSKLGLAGNPRPFLLHFLISNQC